MIPAERTSNEEPDYIAIGSMDYIQFASVDRKKRHDLFRDSSCIFSMHLFHRL